jgi:hypothetical protein
MLPLQRLCASSLGLYYSEQNGQPFNLQIEVLKRDTSLSNFFSRVAKKKYIFP